MGAQQRARDAIVAEARRQQSLPNGPRVIVGGQVRTSGPRVRTSKGIINERDTLPNNIAGGARTQALSGPPVMPTFAKTVSSKQRKSAMAQYERALAEYNAAKAAEAKQLAANAPVVAKQTVVAAPATPSPVAAPVPVAAAAAAPKVTIQEFQAARRPGETAGATLARLKASKAGVIPNTIIKASAGGAAAAAAGPTIAGGGGMAGTALEAFQTAAGLYSLYQSWTGQGAPGSNPYGAAPSLSGGGAVRASMAIPVGITDISPGQPAGDIQVIDPRNILVNANTGRTVKVVPVTAKIQRRRRSRGRGGVSQQRFMMEIERLRSENQQQSMMMMLLARR